MTIKNFKYVHFGIGCLVDPVSTIGKSAEEIFFAFRIFDFKKNFKKHLSW